MRKRIVGFIIIGIVALFLLGGFISYAKFILTHRTQVIFLCTIGIIALMGYRCTLIRKDTAKRIDLIVDNMNNNGERNCASSSETNER